MSRTKSSLYSTIDAALLFSSVGFGQVDIQIRFGQQPGWDPRGRGGRCEVRVWVDHHAELRIRGDGIFVRTLEGAKSYDEGSKCSQPLPYNSIGDFQIRQIAGPLGRSVLNSLKGQRSLRRVPTKPKAKAGALGAFVVRVGAHLPSSAFLGRASRDGRKTAALAKLIGLPQELIRFPHTAAHFRSFGLALERQVFLASACKPRDLPPSGHSIFLHETDPQQAVVQPGLIRVLSKLRFRTFFASSNRSNSV